MHLSKSCNKSGPAAAAAVDDLWEGTDFTVQAHVVVLIDKTRSENIQSDRPDFTRRRNERASENNQSTETKLQQKIQ